MAGFKKRVQQVEDLTLRPGEPLRMLQLSDLHFSHRTLTGLPAGDRDSSLVHLENLLRQQYPRERPCHVVAVTGDLIDFDSRKKGDHRKALLASLTYLQYLCQTVLELPRWKERLMVIPGNHDFRFHGILRRWATGQSLEEAEFYDVFGDFAHHRFFAPAGLLVACFDSNRAKDNGELATGYVDAREFAEVKAAINELPEAAKAQVSRATRVALVHHHPLPIGETDDFERKRLIERLLGRRLDGAPEFMLLRNAGTFLHRLMDDDYRLVLHGHLHCGGYWRPLAYTTGRERWLEVLGCGGSGPTAAFKGDNHVNCLEFHKGAFIRATQVGFNKEGRQLEPRAWPMAPYEVVRAAAPEAGGDLPLRCRSHTVLADVSFPFGDLVTREVIQDLEWLGDKPTDSLPLFVSAAHVLSSPRIEVRSLHQDYKLTIDPTPNPAGAGPEGQRYQYRVRVKPSLRAGHAPITVECQRTWLGVMFASQEDKRHHEVKAESQEWDEYRRLVRWPSDRLTVHVRFWPAAWKLSGFRARVTDANDEEDHYERDTANVTTARWEPTSVAPSQLPHSPGAEAWLSVYQPKVGYSYALQWDLPSEDKMPAPREVRKSREELIGPLDPTIQARLRTLLADAVVAAKSAVRDAVRTREDWTGVNGYWFSYDDHSGQLKCRVSTAPVSDYLTGAKIGWGQDIVGTACRRREGISFSRQAFPADRALSWPLSKEFREGVGAMLAFPVMATENWVLGVVAVASQAEDGPLQTLIENNELARRWFAECATLWGVQLNRLPAQPSQVQPGLERGEPG